MPTKEEIFKASLKVKPLNEYPVQGMDQEQQELFLRFTLLNNELNNEELPAELQEALSKMRMYQMLRSRCLASGMRVSDLVLAYISDSLSFGNPGVGSLYVHAIQVYMVKKKIEVFTWNDFTNLFANGFPSRDVCALAWDAQKVAGENAVNVVLGYKGDDFM